MDAMPLLEREHELALVQTWLADAAQGRGRIGLVRGGAGRGKPALLQHAAALAARQDLRVLGARGGELEREIGFGVARQLFEAPVRALDAGDRRLVLGGAAAHARALLGLADDGGD